MKSVLSRVERVGYEYGMQDQNIAFINKILDHIFQSNFIPLLKYSRYSETVTMATDSKTCLRKRLHDITKEKNHSLETDFFQPIGKTISLLYSP